MTVVATFSPVLAERTFGLSSKHALPTSPPEQPEVSDASTEQPGFQYTSFRARETSRRLGDMWRGVGKGDQAEATQGTRPRLPEKRVYNLQTADCMENRDLKTAYAAVNSDLDRQQANARKLFARLGVGSHAESDPQKPDSRVNVSQKDGWVTVRRSRSMGRGQQEWHEVRYRADGTGDVDVQGSNMPRLSRRGTRVEVGAPDGSAHTYRNDRQGNLQFEATSPRGERRTLTALPDGSQREVTARGTSTIPPDNDMARYEEIAGRLGRSIGPDGKTRELTEQERYILASGLRGFDPATLQNLEECGVHIRLVDHRNRPPGGFPGGRQDWKEDGLAYYNLNEKVLVFRQEDFRKGGNPIIAGTIRHEMGHAVDDMLRSDTAEGRRYHAENDPHLEGLYAQYMTRTARDPQATWSGYARSEPAEYYAEGIRMFLGPPQEREALRRMDPGLFQYVAQTLDVSRDRRLPQYQVEGQFPAQTWPGGGVGPSGPAQPGGAQQEWPQPTWVQPGFFPQPTFIQPQGWQPQPMMWQQMQQLMFMQQLMLLMTMMFAGMQGACWRG